MINRIPVVTQVVSLLGLSACVSAGDFPYARYKPASMQEAVKGMAHLKDRNSDFTFGKGLSAFKVRVNYTGQIRPIDKTTAGFFLAWQKAGYASNLPASVESTFQSEILVSQGKESFWLPVQSPLIPYLREEYPKGGTIDIYIAGVGALRETLVITINAYDGID